MGDTERSSPVTIVDIARVAGVSHSTVSRVMNNKNYIKEETKARVLSVAAELGYTPNITARRLASGRQGVVGLIVPALPGNYVSEVLRGVHQALADEHLDLLVSAWQARGGSMLQEVERLSVGAVDGLIVVLPQDAEALARFQPKAGLPTVVLDYSGPAGLDSVACSNTDGAIAVMEHLAELGHRRIAHITGNLSHAAGRDRLDGYRRAVAMFDLDDDPELIREGDFHAFRGSQAAAELLDLRLPPTAVFAANDSSACGAIETFRHRGITLPDQMSIVGFDDLPEATIIRPTLTTVRQPLDEMARRAVDLVLRRLEDPERLITPVTFETKLIERTSTAKPIHASSIPLPL